MILLQRHWLYYVTINRLGELTFVCDNWLNYVFMQAVSIHVSHVYVSYAMIRSKAAWAKYTRFEKHDTHFRTAANI